MPVRTLREEPVPRALLRLAVALTSATLLAGSAYAQVPSRPATLSEMPIPGGLAAAHAVLDDRIPPDRSRFLVDIIQRLHAVAPVRKFDRSFSIAPLLSLLERRPAGSAAKADTVPLPLDAAFWTDVVFAGRAVPDGLPAAILKSRPASLLYCALLSVDEETRAWIARQPALVADILAHASGAFSVAASGLRVAADGIAVPGGKPAEPAWEAIVGQRVTDPVAFVRAVATNGDGRIAYFLGAMAQLTPAQIAFAFNLHAPDPGVRIDTARRFYDVFQRNASGWRIEERPFWRPPLDPALLLADLAVDDRGRPNVPGTPRLWELVFTGPNASVRPADAEARASSAAGPLDFVWLCEQVFKGSQVVQRRPYEVVLFASRVIRDLPPERMADAVDALRGAIAYPALFQTLERAGLSDVGAYAAAVRRARKLDAIDDFDRASRALAQFQGTIAVLTRAAARGSVQPQALQAAISALAGVELNDRGDYDGRLVRWLLDFVNDRHPNQPESAAPASDTAAPRDGRPVDLDDEIIRLVSGPALASAPLLDWEGTRYRFDPARAEAGRLRSLLGRDAQPWLTTAAGLLSIADALAAGAPEDTQLRAHADDLKALADAVRADAPDEWHGTDAPGRLRAAASALDRTAGQGNAREGARMASTLRLLADDVLGRGLAQIAYAIALGQRDRSLITAGDAASRHDFGLRLFGWGRLSAWRHAGTGADRSRDWHASGSLLGLDLRLSEFALMPLSSRPPAVRPTLNDAARRVFTETAVMIQPAALAGQHATALVNALQKGRERLAAVRTPQEAQAVGGQVGLGPLRRTLLSWTAVYDSARLVSFLSPSELMWLGWGDDPVPEGLHAWGTSGSPRLGCDCLQLPARRSWESLAGRWDSGVTATVFPDLNLRLTELLHELRMPAQLLAHVLPAATFDFIHNATSRWQDDDRGLVMFVQALPVDRVEQYLALLTTTGPLFPQAEGSDEPSAPATGWEVSR